MSTTAFPFLEDDDYWKVDEPVPTTPGNIGSHDNDDYWDPRCKNSIIVNLLFFY